LHRRRVATLLRATGHRITIIDRDAKIPTFFERVIGEVVAGFAERALGVVVVGAGERVAIGIAAK